MKAAFFVIDMQKAFYSGLGAASMDAAAEYINAALPLFRKAGLPVLWVQDMDEDDGTLPGKPGFDLIDSLKPEPGEARIHKTYGNSFNKTEAQAILDAAGIDTVILSGWKAEFCVLSTYRGALDQDLRPYLLKNAIATDVPERKDFVESISDTVPLSLLFRLIK